MCYCEIDYDYERRDYGFDLPDLRDKWYVYDGPVSPDEIDEDGFVDREPIDTLTLTIRRVWQPCQICGGASSDFRCEYDLVEVSTGRTIPFPTEEGAAAYVGIVYPHAERAGGWIAEDTGRWIWG